jgi:hypothetical protein
MLFERKYVSAELGIGVFAPFQFTFFSQKHEKSHGLNGKMLLQIFSSISTYHFSDTVRFAWGAPTCEGSCRLNL